MKDTLLSRSVKENFIKNILILLLGILWFPVLQTKLSVLSEFQSGDLLLILSMLLVTVCFANFAFSYEYSNLQKISTRLVAHIATAIFMFLIMIFLIMITLIGGIVYPSLYEILFTVSVFLYVGCVLYDFWDLLRIAQKSE